MKALCLVSESAVALWTDGREGIQASASIQGEAIFFFFFWVTGEMSIL